MPQQTFFAWNIIFTICTYGGMLMQELAFQCDVEGLPLSSHIRVQLSRAHRVTRWQLTTPRTYCTMPSNFRHQTHISSILISLFFLICALHLHIHMFCYFDKHMCQLLSSRSNFPFDVFSFRLLINFRCLLNYQRKYAGIKTTEWHFVHEHLFSVIFITDKQVYSYFVGLLNICRI